jgi:hypothetical protein
VKKPNIIERGVAKALNAVAKGALTAGVAVGGTAAKGAEALLEEHPTKDEKLEATIRKVLGEKEA